MWRKDDLKPTRESIKESVGKLFTGVLDKFDPKNPDSVPRDDMKLQKGGLLKPFHAVLLPPVLNHMSSLSGLSPRP